MRAQIAWRTICSGLGVARGSLVGLCLQRTPDMVVALLAVMKSGGAYVPLDPGFPRDRLRFMVEDSGLSLVITHPAVADPRRPRATACSTSTRG